MWYNDYIIRENGRETMRKKEYIYLHALLEEVCQHVAETDQCSDDAFAEYEAQDVSASGIHRRKAAHHEAISLLADGIVTAVETHERSSDPPRTDAVEARTDGRDLVNTHLDDDRDGDDT